MCGDDAAIDRVPTAEEMRELALRILAERYPGAAFAFAAGSLIRGEGTASSDLDLVVIFESLPHAWRESFEYAGRPVEAFVHDPETLQYFMVEEDCRKGYPIMPHMIVSGLVIPQRSEMSDRVQKTAKALLEKGPLPLHEREWVWMRYLITDALDDLRTARSPEERAATAAALYDTLGNAYLRRRGRWSGKGKWLPRLLRETDAGFGERFVQAFDAVWRCGDVTQLRLLAEEALTPFGGLFRFSDGYRMEAKPECRRPVEQPATKP